MDDDGLIERARQGDEDAFAQLFTRYQRAVYRYAAYMGGRDAGDDIVQETFLVLLRQGGRTDAPRGTVGAYLLGIARHIVLKRFASPRLFELAEDVEAEADGDTLGADRLTALDELTRAETIDAVRAAVQSLPASYREAVVLCELQEMDYTEAAVVMRCPIGTVRSRLHRARTLLAAKLAAMQPAAGSTRGK